MQWNERGGSVQRKQSMIKKSSMRVALLSCVILLAVSVSRANAAEYRMPITFAGYTNRTEVLTNFPVLVH